MAPFPGDPETAACWLRATGPLGWFFWMDCPVLNHHSSASWRGSCANLLPGSSSWSPQLLTSGHSYPLLPIVLANHVLGHFLYRKRRSVHSCPQLLQDLFKVRAHSPQKDGKDRKRSPLSTSCRCETAGCRQAGVGLAAALYPVLPGHLLCSQHLLRFTCP